jgi:hypothetical protein
MAIKDGERGYVMALVDLSYVTQLLHSLTMNLSSALHMLLSIIIGLFKLVKSVIDYRGYFSTALRKAFRRKKN